jgi:hypothetical protein
MAIALTDEQRIEIRNSTRFQDMVRAGMSNKALFWTLQDTMTTPPAGDYIRWARSRNLGADLIHSPATLETEKTYSQAAIFLKDKPVNPSDDETVFILDDVIGYMIDNDAFDTLADAIFDEQIKGRIGF